MLHLLDHVSGESRGFRPLGDPVTIYVCGITPYDTTHLGHAFTYVSFDVLIRYLEYQGKSVRYVQNVTDIDDDILRKGREVGEDWLALGNRWTRHFIEDLAAMNVRPPEVYPRASDVIAEMHEAIGALIERGHAYESAGNVYYAVASFDRFGEVSGLPQAAWLPTANERGNFPDDPNKRDPLDFVLWQATNPGEPSWESPWGPGRPGWHIECSTMAKRYLGDQIDIHGGGSDLAFPHHECEAAQSCGVTGADSFAQHWLHTAMVHYEGEKMSKSLGNLVWARELMDGFGADAVRVLISSHPYDRVWHYQNGEIEQAAEKAALIEQATTVDAGAEGQAAVDALAAFDAAMDDNLATDRALDIMLNLAQQILANREQGVTQKQAALQKMANVMGLRFGAEPEERVQEGWARHITRFA